MKIRNNIDRYYAVGDGPNPVAIACVTEEGEIVGCLVDNDHRNQGIMTKLITNIVDGLSDEYDKIHFGTIKSNEAMNRVGEKLGWERIDEDDAYRYVYYTDRKNNTPDFEGQAIFKGDIQL